MLIISHSFWKYVLPEAAKNENNQCKKVEKTILYYKQKDH